MIGPGARDNTTARSSFLGDAVEEFLIRAHIHLPDTPAAEPTPERPLTTFSVTPAGQGKSPARLLQKWNLYQRVQELHREAQKGGLSLELSYGFTGAKPCQFTCYQLGGFCQRNGDLKQGFRSPFRWLSCQLSCQYSFCSSAPKNKIAWELASQAACVVEMGES